MESIRKETDNPDLGFFEIDSDTEDGIPELKEAIAQAAAGLRHVGESFPESYDKVCRRLLKRAKKETHLSWDKYISVCEKLELGDEDRPILAGILDALGHVLYRREIPGSCDRLPPAHTAQKSHASPRRLDRPIQFGPVSRDIRRARRSTDSFQSTADI